MVGVKVIAILGNRDTSIKDGCLLAVALKRLGAWNINQQSSMFCQRAGKSAQCMAKRVLVQQVQDGREQIQGQIKLLLAFEVLYSPELRRNPQTVDCSLREKDFHHFS